MTWLGRLLLALGIPLDELAVMAVVAVGDYACVDRIKRDIAERIVGFGQRRIGKKQAQESEEQTWP